MLTTIATFPGIIMHELAHVIACRLVRVKVMKACYLRLGNPPGYVIHERPASVLGDVVIGFGPLLFNTLLGAAIALPGAMTVRKLHLGSGMDYVLLWLGISIAMHSFPSTGDARSIWGGVWHSQSGLLARILALPFIAIIYIGALGSIFRLDLIYAIAAVLLFPDLLRILIR